MAFENMRRSFQKKRVESCCKNEAPRLERDLRMKTFFKEICFECFCYAFLFSQKVKRKASAINNSSCKRDIRPVWCQAKRRHLKTCAAFFKRSGWSPVARTKPRGLSYNLRMKASFKEIYFKCFCYAFLFFFNFLNGEKQRFDTLTDKKERA
jgi:hypothetical protein